MIDDSRPQPREAVASEWTQLVHALALAFEDDPVIEFIFPDPQGRLGRLKRFYALTIPRLADHGRMTTVDGVPGAAIWQAPSPPGPQRLGQAWLLARLVWVLGRRSGAVMQLGEMMERHHLREPHWYLGFLGTAPAHQGRGFGSAMMDPVLSLCDEQGMVGYLESSKEQNIPFYERHGFAVTGEIQIASGLKLWPMRREPQGR